MKTLPNRESAIFEQAKLVEYCLNPVHPRGRHKARLFREVLGIEHADAEDLRSTLLEGLGGREATRLVEDAFGTRWRVDVPIERRGRGGVVRTIWIVRQGEAAPRFVTCWVL